MTSILLTSSSEYGQSQIILSTATEILETCPEPVHLHMASFDAIKSRIDKLQQTVKLKNPKSSITFHSLGPYGIHGKDATIDKEYLTQMLRAPPFLRNGSLKTGKMIATYIIANEGPVYAKIYRTLLQIISDVNPVLGVCDFIFPVGRDAFGDANLPYVMTSVTCGQELAKFHQPSLFEAVFRLPSPTTGLPYPVPWYLMPFNLLALVAFIGFLAFSKRTRDFLSYRKQQNIGRGSLYPSLAPLDTTRKYIVASSHAMEYPFINPGNLVMCGPIVPKTAFTNVDDWDKEMSNFVEQGPTILFCLGSEFTYTLRDVTTIIDCLSDTLDTIQTRHGLFIQIIWKLPSANSTFQQILQDAPQIFKQHVSVVDWLVAPIPVLLNHPNVILSINHAGANSFGEAIQAGVSQVLLGFWADLYDIASRAEYLGIGIYANKNVAPEISRDDLKNSILDILEVDSTNTNITSNQGQKDSLSIFTNTKYYKAAKSIAQQAKNDGGASTSAAVILEQAKKLSTQD